jgi:putative transposase
LFEKRSLSQSRWKWIGASNAILVQPPPHDDPREELMRRINMQTVPANAETAAMLFLALLASGQITMCKASPESHPVISLTSPPG